MTDKGTKNVIPTATQERMVAAARAGQSIETLAHMAGLSRRSLRRIRVGDPAFDARILGALAEYDAELNARLTAALDSGDSSMVKAVSDVLARRFPTRYGVDPRFRIDPLFGTVVDELADEDAEPVSATEAQSAGTKLAEAIDALLASRMGPTE